MYPDQESLDVVNEWERNLKHANLIGNLKRHDGMKIILAGLEKELAVIRKKLVDDASLFESEKGVIDGRILHARKEWIKRFISLFTGPEKQVEMLNKMIDKKLLDHDNENN